MEHHLLLFAGMQEQEDVVLQTMEEQIENLLKDYLFPVTLHLIPTNNYSLQKIYRARTPRLFLVRPDGHIAYSGQADDRESLRAYLNRVFTCRRVASSDHTLDKPFEMSKRLLLGMREVLGMSVEKFGSDGHIAFKFGNQKINLRPLGALDVDSESSPVRGHSSLSLYR